MENTTEDFLSSEAISTENKMKGDTIGNTAYSERFVLGTLMKLLKSNKLENGEFKDFVESDLCALWDMAIDIEVCQFLLCQNALEIFCDTLSNHEDPRLTEVVIGTMANMCAHQTIVKDINNKEFVRKCICSYINSEDSLIIIQVVRYISSNICHNVENIRMWLHLFEELDLLTSFIFILNNSLNCNVLSNLLSLVYSICKLIDDSNKMTFRKLFSNERFSKALIVGYLEIEKQTPNKEKIARQTNLNFLHIVSTLINLEETPSVFNVVKKDLINISNSILSNSLNNKSEYIANILQYVTSCLIVLNNCDCGDIKRLCCTMFLLWDFVLNCSGSEQFEGFEDFNQCEDIFPQYFVRILGLLSKEDLIEITRNLDKNSIGILKVKISLMIFKGEIDRYFSNIPDILQELM